MLGEQALPVQALDKAFDKWWPDLEPALNNAKTEALCIHITKPPETKPSDSEISELVFDYVKSKRHHLQDEDTHPPENAYLRGKWVDAAYLLPRDGGPGVIYFGSIVSIEFDKRHGAMICTGRNYSYEQTRLGWYKANSSQIGDLKMFYTFEWQPVDGSELILGCGRLMLTGPPLNSGKAIGLQYLTYGGTFISEKLPNFTYEGRRILPEEEDREQAGELVANWIKELSDQRKYRIATKEELNNLFM
jgi:hypothetical protein